MLKGDYDRLKDLAKYNVCSEHHTPLEVAWYGQEKTWALRCGHDHYPDAITRQLSLTEMYKAGEELPCHIEGKVKKGMRRRQMQQGKQPTAMTFPGVPAVDLETGELLSLEMVKALVAYAYKYDLDPCRGHVVVMHGQPYIGIDGYLFHAHNKNIPYSLTGRPLTGDELKVQGYEPGDLGWYSKVERHDTHQVFEGYGFIKKSELVEMSKKKPDRLRYPVVAAKPGVMVIKRAEWQALRRAFPIGETKEETNETRDESSVS